MATEVEVPGLEGEEGDDDDSLHLIAITLKEVQDKEGGRHDIEKEESGSVFQERSATMKSKQTPSWCPTTTTILLFPCQIHAYDRSYRVYAIAYRLH